MDDYEKGKEEIQKDTQELLRRVLANPDQKLRIIQEYYGELVARGDKVASANEVLTVRAMLMAGEPQNNSATVPGWFLVAGVVFGGLTLLFFMVLVVASIFKATIPSESRFLVVVVLALGTALSSAFLGGSAAAAGKVPIFKNSPMKFTVTGGIAAFIIVLVLGHFLYQ
jgi:hypothetical protein